MLNLDKTEDPIYEIIVKDTEYSFDPFLMAIELQSCASDTDDIAVFYKSMNSALDAGKLGEMPELSIHQIMEVYSDFSKYIEELQKKIEDSHPSQNSTVSDTQKVWQQVQESQKKNSSSGSTLTKTAQGSGEPSLTTTL